MGYQGRRVWGRFRGVKAPVTRVSQTEQGAVLVGGRRWLDRAFVVNEWYVSAYGPISDHRGQRVGMLYVGFLERPFTMLKYAVLAAIGALFFTVMIAAAYWSLRAARGIFEPVERMERTMRTFQTGDVHARVGSLRSQDELGHLARGLDVLLDVIAQKTRSLQEWNAVLDARVAERTAELQAAQQQLMRSEKLAVIGQLTAGRSKRKIDGEVRWVKETDARPSLLSPVTSIGTHGANGRP